MFFEGELNLCWGTGEEQHLVAHTVIVRWVRLDPRADNSVPRSWHTSNNSVEIAHYCQKLCIYFNSINKKITSIYFIIPFKLKRQKSYTLLTNFFAMLLSLFMCIRHVAGQKCCSHCDKFNPKAAVYFVFLNW